MNARTLVGAVKRFLGDESGPTATEYAIMLALIIVVCMGGISAVGTGMLAPLFETSNTAMFG